MLQPSQRSARYSAVAIGLHWAIAGMLLGLIWLGWNMHGPNGREVEWAYQMHKSIGITVLILTIARVIWRVKNPPPPLPEELKSWERTASHGVHMAFYAIMLFIPIGGWALASMAKVQVPTVLYGTVSWPHLPILSTLGPETKASLYGMIEFVHSKSAWLIIALLALHIGGALKHEFSEEDGVLKRMIPGLFGKTDGPQAPPTGFLVAFGSAFAAFVLVAGSPVVAQTLSGTPEITASESGITNNWEIDKDASSIAFTFDHDGGTYTGNFSSWDADIAFIEDNLAASSVAVSVDLSSASDLKKLYIDSLKAAEWLNSAVDPLATVALSEFKTTDAGYAATAALTLKGQTVSVPFDFTLTEQDNKTVMTGSASFSRKSLDLGQMSDANAEWVSEDIRVNVTVTATPK